MSTVAEKRFSALLSDRWVGATPGLCLQSYQGGRKKIDLRIGKTYPYYDLASLTKVIFTASLSMKLVEQKALSLSAPLHQSLSWFPEKSNISLKDLFTHSAGLDWWQPFYKELNPSLNIEGRWRQLIHLMKDRIKPRLKTDIAARAVYSDLDLFVVGDLLKTVTKKTLLELWQEHADELKLTRTHFHENNKATYKIDLYAPTEDCTFRGRILQGEVHDENAWALGGVAPHAGLFGSIDDVMKFNLGLRSSVLSTKASRAAAGWAKPETVQKFARRAIPKARGDWAMGLMIPTKASASCGRYFGAKSIGHTGFTGTSMWFDPKADLIVVILANRVHPTRENKTFVNLRPELHNLVWEALYD